MKYVLFLLMCVKLIISIDVDNCMNRHNNDGVPIYQCEIFNFKPVNKDESQSMKICLQPIDHFINVAVSSHYSSGHFNRYIFQLDKKSLNDGTNEVVLITKKYGYTNQVNLFVNGKLKMYETMEDWELKRISLMMSGSWNGARKFESINETHSTNCPQNGESAATKPFRDATFPWTPKPLNNVSPFIQCKEPFEIKDKNDKSSSTTTLCLIDRSYLQRLDKELNIKICYTRETTFERISISKVKPVNDSPQITDILSIDKFTRSNSNETELIIKPDPSDKRYEISFNNYQTTSRSKAEILEEEGSLAIIFYGGWVGSRNFIFGNNHIFSNCHNEGLQTSAFSTTMSTTTRLPTQSTTTFGTNDVTNEELDRANDNGKNEWQASVIYAAGSILLIFVIFGVIVTCLVFLKARNAKKATRGSSIRHDRLPEVRESTSDLSNATIPQKLDDSVYYANIPSHGQVQEESRRDQFHESEELTYLELDFGAKNQKQKKANKLKNRGSKAANKLESGPPMDTEETAYACIMPEVVLKKEEVAYANVGDYLSRNRGDRNFDGEVIYANVNER